MAGRVIPPILNWKGISQNTDLINGATPSPRLEYLAALVNRVQAACAGPYAMTGLAAYLERSSDKVLAQQVVNIATKALQPVIIRGASNVTATPDDTSIYSTTSGSAASDEILIASPFDRGSEAYPPDLGLVATLKGALAYEASPLAAQDRLLESPTATALTGAQVERIEVKRGLGFTLVPILVADIAAL